MAEMRPIAAWLVGPLTLPARPSCYITAARWRILLVTNVTQKSWLIIGVQFFDIHQYGEPVTSSSPLNPRIVVIRRRIASRHGNREGGQLKPSWFSEQTSDRRPEDISTETLELHLVTIQSPFQQSIAFTPSLIKVKRKLQ